MAIAPALSRPLQVRMPRVPTNIGAPTRAEPCASCGVRQISVCRAIDPAKLDRLAALAVTEQIPPGRSFIQEGDRAENFFTVTCGTVRLFKLLPDGRRQITGFGVPGHFLGLAVAPHYTFSAEAVDDVQVCRFSRPRLKQLLHDFPALETRLLEVASSELAAAQEQILLLGRKTARERVASFLLTFLESTHLRGPLPSRVHLPMTRADIADYLGLTVETVSRTLTHLKSERLIALHGPGEIEILEMSHLSAVAEAAEQGTIWPNALP